MLFVAVVPLLVPYVQVKTITNPNLRLLHASLASDITATCPEQFSNIRNKQSISLKLHMFFICIVFC